MKKFLTFILIGATIGIAAFGFVLMTHNGMSIPGNCVATTINGGAICSDNPIASAIYHLQALQFFGTAVFSASLLSLLIMALAAIVIVGFLKNNPETSFIELSSALLFVNPSQIRFRKWLAFHELSPPHITAAR